MQWFKKRVLGQFQDQFRAIYTEKLKEMHFKDNAAVVLRKSTLASVY